MPRDNLQAAEVGKYFAECAAFPVPHPYQTANDVVILEGGGYITFGRIQGTFSLNQPLLRDAAVRVIYAATNQKEALSQDTLGDDFSPEVVDFTARLLAKNRVIVSVEIDKVEVVGESDVESHRRAEQRLAEKICGFPLVLSRDKEFGEIFRGHGEEHCATLIVALSDVCDIEVRARALASRKYAFLAVLYSEQGVIAFHRPSHPRAACLKCALIRFGLLRKGKPPRGLGDHMQALSVGTIEALTQSIHGNFDKHDVLSTALVHTMHSGIRSESNPILRVPGCDGCVY